MKQIEAQGGYRVTQVIPELEKQNIIDKEVSIIIMSLQTEREVKGCSHECTLVPDDCVSGCTLHSNRYIHTQS